MSTQDTIISLLREIDKNIDNVGSGGNVPKVKVSAINIKEDCVDEDGVWDGENIDISNVTSLVTFGAQNQKIKRAKISNWDTSNVIDIERLFYNSTNLENIDVSKWDVSSVLKTGSAFQNCTKLSYLDVSNWKTDNFVSLYALFTNSSIEVIDFRNWKVPNVTNTTAFISMQKCTSIIGGEDIDSVLTNNTKCLDGIKVSFSAYYTKLDRASLRALINGLADLTGETAQTLTLNETLIAKLTEEDIAIATAKNWTIA